MDANSETRLRELRLNLAEICLEGRVDRIASLCRNPTGDALMTMINSGVRHLAMAKGDQAVAERCHRILSVEHDVDRKVAAYLALNLFTFPHSIDRCFDIVDVPTPLIATVVAPGGHVVLAGMLLDQVPGVVAAFAAGGLTVVGADELDGWGSAVLRR